MIDPDMCCGCAAELGTRHRDGCPYEHPWPRDKVNHVQTLLMPVQLCADPPRETHPTKETDA